jgi:adenylate cyclase
MKSKIRFRQNIRTVFVITIFWALFASFSYVIEYFSVYDLLQMNRLSGTYEFLPDFIGTLILSALAGFVFGYLLVFKIRFKFQKRSFLFGIIGSGILFSVIYMFLAVFGIFTIDIIYFSFQMDLSQAFKDSVDNVILNIGTPSFFVNMIAWAAMVSFTQFMLQVNFKFGPGVLWKFITGKYFKPKQEERIFMFLDLKSSTTIAENIGSQNFFNLLKDVYFDITEPVVNSMGEIYQYVGDEVVITWMADDGLADNNCLLCFTRIKQALKERKAYYIKRYQQQPSFKAGLHIGEATVGEIGVIKKDIVFSGDVLNTTSRIQAECNKHNVDLLITSTLLQRMDMLNSEQVDALGEIQLKGKKEKVDLYTIKF